MASSSSHPLPSAPEPQHHQSLLFPSASTSLSSTLTSLKRSNLSITNRLHSINQDSKFVQRVSSAYELPLIANERCGSWYIPPGLKAGSAYFKSTDGHFGEWSVSLRRLNLGVLDAVEKHGGCIIVDSTRRGKSMPDALSKTIPIWICAMNRLLFPDQSPLHVLRTPDDVVSESEHAQIDARMDAFVEGLRSLALDLTSLRDIIKHRPLRPVWVTPEDSLPSSPPGSDSPSEEGEGAFHKIVLCTASGRVSNSMGTCRFDYVQGAADDSESWACGLDAPTYWSHQDTLLEAIEDDLPALIQQLAKESQLVVSVRQSVQIKPTTFWIGSTPSAEVLALQDWDLVVLCGPIPDNVLQLRLKEQYVHLQCGTGKVGSRQLRAQLPKIEKLSKLLHSDASVLVTCPTGKDLAVGVALAMICLYCSDRGSFSNSNEDGMRPVPNKAQIKQRLSWIMVSVPDAAPSRATLQSVNAFLMG